MNEIMDSFSVDVMGDGLYHVLFRQMNTDSLVQFYDFQWELYRTANPPPYMGLLLDLRRVDVVPFTHMMTMAQERYHNEPPAVMTRYALLMEERTFTRLGATLLHTLPSNMLRVRVFPPERTEAAVMWLQEPIR